MKQISSKIFETILGGRLMRGLEKNHMGRGQKDTLTDGHRDSMKESAKGQFFEKTNLVFCSCSVQHQLRFAKLNFTQKHKSHNSKELELLDT